MFSCESLKWFRFIQTLFICKFCKWKKNQRVISRLASRFQHDLGDYSGALNNFPKLKFDWFFALDFLQNFSLLGNQRCSLFFLRRTYNTATHNTLIDSKCERDNCFLLLRFHDGWQFYKIVKHSVMLLLRIIFVQQFRLKPSHFFVLNWNLIISLLQVRSININIWCLTYP